MEEKQKNILRHGFELNPKLIIPKKNILTLNLQSVYECIKIKIKNDKGIEIEKEIDDETWKLFNGIRPSDEFLNGTLPFNSITGQDFEKPIRKEDLTEGFLKDFSEMYKNFIELYEDVELNHKIKSIEKFEEHTGNENTVKSSLNGDINIYLIKGFNYKTDFNDEERKEFEELMKF